VKRNKLKTQHIRVMAMLFFMKKAEQMIVMTLFIDMLLREVLFGMKNLKRMNL
jgi:hypothetical protein